MNGFYLYSYLYFFSGFLFPTIIFFVSNEKFLSYKFNNQENNNNVKNLTLIVICNLLLLSILISKYIIAFLNLSLQFVNKYNLNYSIGSNISVFINLLIIFLLLFYRSRIFIKRLTLVVFFLISISLWLATNNMIDLDYSNFYNQTIFYNLVDIKYINIINISSLFLIEITYYLWSYISHDRNLSNWKVITPVQKDFYPLLYIFFFYVANLIYYFKLY